MSADDPRCACNGPREPYQHRVKYTTMPGQPTVMVEERPCVCGGWVRVHLPFEDAHVWEGVQVHRLSAVHQAWIARGGMEGPEFGDEPPLPVAESGMPDAADLEHEMRKPQRPT